jgi:hypothetical protein
VQYYQKAKMKSTLSQKLKKRGRRIGQWCLMPILLASGYMCLPFACCVHNPIPRIVLYDEEEDCENKRHTDVDFNGYVQGTCGAGFLGIIGSFCCIATACGCVGTCSPRQVID